MLKFYELTLKSRTKVADDAYALSFSVPEDLREKFEFLPGQHLAVRATVKGQPLRRTYSLVSPAGELNVSGELKIGVRVQGGMSRYLGEELQPNERLEIMPPGGSFHPQLNSEHAKFYVAVAAGSGITPIVSIIASALSKEPNSQFLLLYANRSLARTMFAEELLALKNRFPARLAVHFLMSREPQEIELFNGRLDAPKLDALAAGLFDVNAVDEFFLCGPGAMVDELAGALRARNVPGKIHIELFDAVAPSNASALTPVEQSSAAKGVTEVTVLMDGRRRSFKMQKNGGFILDAAEQAGLDLPFACRAGVCSTCRTKVVSGQVTMDYNQALEDWEVAAGYVLCCQSRALSDQVELNYDER